MNDFKTNLTQLNKLNEYYIYLNESDKTDNLTNIKKFYNEHIFISIVDFENGHYRLFSNRHGLKNYLRDPKKIMNRNLAKRERRLKIFLKDVSKL